MGFDALEFRRVLGHYPTGVCAVTAMAGATPIGMIVGSFTSVSLEPPLVAFFPDRRSTTWAGIERAGRFCVNILADCQHGVCRALSAKGEDKFRDIPYRLSESGLPVIEGGVGRIDCDLYAVHEAGDHFVVIGQVHSLEAEQVRRPLLFFQGGYGQFAPLTMSA